MSETRPPEVEELVVRLRDHANHLVAIEQYDWANANRQAADLLSSQAALLREAMEALEPFARLIVGKGATAPVPMGIWPDDEPHWKASDHLWGSRVTVAMIRRAATVLARWEGGE